MYLIGAGQEINGRKEKTKLWMMKQILHIAADFDKPELLKSMVEKLVLRRTETNRKQAIAPIEHEALDTSSTEAFVCGSISIDDEGDHVKIPFDSSFLFTCIKGIGGQYEVTWSASLS